MTFDPESLARWSAWPAFICYAVAITIWLMSPLGRRDRAGRVLWTIGWLTLVVHISIAMLLVHHGSWTAAYEHTAKQTRAAVGWDWGGGVWLNLLTAAVWGVDVALLWARPINSPSLRFWSVFGQSYLAFMLFNATLVFGSLPAQIGSGICCILMLLGLVRRASRTSPEDQRL
jgi:hypothetical protein